MGRYNFSSEKLRQIESENAEFRATISRLSNTVEKLEKALASVGESGENPEKSPKREIISNLEREKFLNVFGIDVQDGKIVKTSDRVKTTNYCNTLFAGAMRFLFPEIRQKKLTCRRLHELSESEYEIAIETFQAIVDTLDYAKKKLTENRGNHNE